LLATGALFVVLGVVEVVLGTRAAARARADSDWRRRYLDNLDRPEAVEDVLHGHDEDEAHPAAWLLCIPAFLALLIPPPALGSYVAGRAPATVRMPPANTVYQPLPDGPIQLRVIDYAQRAVWDHGRTLQGHTITMTGFVTPRLDGKWYLTRMHIVCCAADAQTAMVEIETNGATPTRDTWVTVTGTWLPSTDPDPARAIPRLAATSINEVQRPADPYE
jgi:uncharacterized repeat protein (TIGR03943 family)